MTTTATSHVVIRYVAPGEYVHRECEASGATLREAAIALVDREKWRLGGTGESLRWVRVELIIPDESATWLATHYEPQLGRVRAAEIRCVSTGDIDPLMLCPPGPPRVVSLRVLVPASTAPGLIILFPAPSAD